MLRFQAHRGDSFLFPENTMASYRAAIREGYLLIELDPRYTSDGHFVLLHDPSVNRTGRRADGSALEVNTRLTDITLEEARQLEYGSWKDEKFRGEQLPTLADVLAMVREAPQVALKLDNVWNYYPPEVRKAFLKELADSGLGSQIGLTFCKMELIPEVVAALPQAQIHWDGTCNPENFRKVAEMAAGHQIYFWLCFDNPETSWYKEPKASEELCACARSLGARVGIWLLKHPDELAEAVRRFNPDAIETNGQLKP